MKQYSFSCGITSLIILCTALASVGIAAFDQHLEKLDIHPAARMAIANALCTVVAFIVVGAILYCL